MRVLILFLSVLSRDTIHLSPAKIDSILYRESPRIKSNIYAKDVAQNAFLENLIGLFFEPEISYTKEIMDTNPANYSEGLNLKISIFSPYKLNALSASFFSYKRARYSFKSNYNAAYTQLLNALFNYVYYKELIDRDTLNMNYSGKMLALVKRRFNLGVADSFDLFKAQDNFESANLLYLQDKSAIEDIKREIQNILGIDCEFDIDLQKFQELLFSIPEYTPGYEVLLEKESKSVRKAQLVFSLLSVLPEVGIIHRFNYMGDSFERDLSNFEHTKTFRIYFLIRPLDFLFNLRKAHLDYRKTLLNFKSALLEDKRKFDKLQRDYTLIKEKLNILSRKKYLKEKSFVLVMERYGQGTASILDVLKEQSDYMSELGDYIKTNLDLIKLKYEIYLNYGGRK